MIADRVWIECTDGFGLPASLASSCAYLLTPPRQLQHRAWPGDALLRRTLRSEVFRNSGCYLRNRKPFLCVAAVRIRLSFCQNTRTCNSAGASILFRISKMCLRVGGWLHMMSRHGQIEANIAGKYSVAPRHLSKRPVVPGYLTPVPRRDFRVSVLLLP